MLKEEKEKLLNEDLYNLFEVEMTASVDDIKKAWKKLALKWHPDRNLDNPNAAAMFLKITNAFDILSDPQERKKYDDKFKAKASRDKRKRELDQNTRDLRDQLYHREELARKKRKSEEDTKATLEQEIVKLRQEAERIRLQELEKQRQKEVQKALQKDRLQRTIEVSWKQGTTTYTEEEIRKIFGVFGKIEAMALAKSGAGGAIQYESLNAALSAERTLKNHPTYKFLITPSYKSDTEAQAPYDEPSPIQTMKAEPSSEDILKNHEEFEKRVFENMMKKAKQQKSEQT